MVMEKQSSIAKPDNKLKNIIQVVEKEERMNIAERPNRVVRAESKKRLPAKDYNCSQCNQRITSDLHVFRRHLRMHMKERVARKQLMKKPIDDKISPIGVTEPVTVIRPIPKRPFISNTNNGFSSKLPISDQGLSNDIDLNLSLAPKEEEGNNKGYPLFTNGATTITKGIPDLNVAPPPPPTPGRYIFKKTNNGTFITDSRASSNHDNSLENHFKLYFGPFKSTGVVDNNNNSVHPSFDDWVNRATINTNKPVIHPSSKGKNIVME